jgi:hypothetical protein
MCTLLAIGAVATASAQTLVNPSLANLAPVISEGKPASTGAEPGPGPAMISTSSAVSNPVIAPRGKSYATALSSESQSFEHLTASFIRTVDDDDYLRILSTSGRQPLLAPPFGARARSGALRSSLRTLAAPTLSRAYTSDSSLRSLMNWYSQKYGFQFITRSTPIDGSNGSDTMVVARAVRQIQNTIVSVMIWNPTQGSKGRKGSHGTISRQTSIEVQERSFRPREELIVEGPDAVVEFTWAVPYRDLISKISVKYQLDPYLLAALVQQESGFNAGAMSVDSAQGLTQMIPATAAMLGISNPGDPHQSLDGGARYLKLMLQRFRGDVKLALAAYNAGPGNVEKYRGIPPFAETRDYVKRIMARYIEKAGGPKALVAQASTKSSS